MRKGMVMLGMAMLLGGVAPALVNEGTISVVYAASDFVIEDGVLTSYVGEGGDVVIPEGVTRIESGAFENQTKITSVVLPEGVTSIGGRAFAECTAMKSINLPEGLLYIGETAFINCSSLESLIFPDSLYFAPGFGVSLYGCTALRHIHFGKDFETWYQLGGGIDEPIFHAPNVERITFSSENKFFTEKNGCVYMYNDAEKDLPLYYRGKKTLVFVPANAKNVQIDADTEVIGAGAFENNTVITEVIIPDKVSLVSDRAFAECTSLKKVVFPKNLKTIGEQAFQASRLTELDLSEANQLTVICSAAFAECKDLVKVMLPEGLVRLIADPWGGPNVFDNCTALKSIRIPKSVMEVSKFRGCTALANVYYTGSEKECNINWHEGFFAVVNPTTKVYYDWISFTDVKIDTYYEKAINYIFNRKIMSGTSKTTFAPANNLTRGQVAVLLWNLEGCPEVKTSRSFADVPADKYYSKAVEWAKSQKIMNGKSDGTFAPRANITRQDFMVTLMNYARYKKLNVSVADKDAYKECPDASKVSSYALGAIQWGYSNGLIGAGKDKALSPLKTISRGDTAVILQRFLVNNKL